MKKRITNIAVSGVIFLVAWIIVGLADSSQNKRICTEVSTSIENLEDNEFLNEKKVVQLIRDIHGGPLKNDELGRISVAEIEYRLRENHYVKEVEVYKTLDGRVRADMELRKPVARVIYPAGGGFYLDQAGYKIPLSQDFFANTILVSGHFYEPLEPSDSLKHPALQAVLPLLNHLDSEPALKAQFSEVVLDKRMKATLYPEVGDVKVEFGEVESVEEKFENLDLFYDQVLNKVGWDKYESVNLSYRNKIFAKKRKS